MKFILVIPFLFLLVLSQAQTNLDYQKDLLELRFILEKTPSYKEQIKGQRLVSFDSIYKKLFEQKVTNISDYNYFYNLSQLLFQISDNHLGFYQIANFPTESDFPIFKGDIDSLKSILAIKPVDSIEGIYHYDNYYSLGLFKKNNTEYIGVILDTKLRNWKTGQIAAYLYEFLPNCYKAIYAHPKFKNYNLYQIEKFNNQSLENSSFYSSFTNKHYTKNLLNIDFVNLLVDNKEFIFRTIDQGIQYLHIKHFSANKNKLEVSNNFYDSIKNQLIEPNLILDLRNNNGGAEKVSEKFFKLIKQYSKQGSVYVLVNNGTLSQGEIFVLQLKELKNIKILGQTTKGMLTYGSNYGERKKLPSQSFEIYITDMKGGKNLLPFENHGIQPDIILSNSSDWIEQVIGLIKKK